jgi:hypothetical protein
MKKNERRNLWRVANVDSLKRVPRATSFFSTSNDEAAMKRILTNRWTQLVAALSLLPVLGAGYTWFADHLPPRPRITLQLDEMPLFSPDGKLLLTRTFIDASHEESGFVLWEVETGKRRWSIPIDCTELHDIKFSPDGKVFAAKRKTHLLIWNTSDGEQRLDKEIGRRVWDGMNGENFWTCFSPCIGSARTGSLPSRV